MVELLHLRTPRSTLDGAEFGFADSTDILRWPWRSQVESIASLMNFKMFENIYNYNSTIISYQI